MYKVETLTIAGSDCSGGAGIQADLKTFSAIGIYGMSKIKSIMLEATLIEGYLPVEARAVEKNEIENTFLVILTIKF